MRLAVACGVAVVAITEALSAVHAVGRVPLLICWALFAVWVAWRKWSVPVFSRDPVVLLCAAGSAAVLALTGVTAALSPPNSADTMAYHLPRVVYWAQQGSVRFFPTPYLN
jgi:hypothetical protein